MKIALAYEPLTIKDEDKFEEKVLILLGDRECVIPLPDLDQPLPVGSIIKMTDITKNVPLDNEDGDVWFKVFQITYTKDAPDTIFMMVSIEDTFDITEEEIAAALIYHDLNLPYRV